MPRLEVRLDGVDMRGLSTSSAAMDTWYLEGQVHVSL